MENGWTREWPQKEGRYWFFGWDFGYDNKDPVMRNVLVQDFGTWFLYVCDGNIISKTGDMVAIGIWHEAEIPEIPEKYLSLKPE